MSIAIPPIQILIGPLGDSPAGPTTSWTDYASYLDTNAAELIITKTASRKISDMTYSLNNTGGAALTAAGNLQHRPTQIVVDGTTILSGWISRWEPTWEANKGNIVNVQALDMLSELSQAYFPQIYITERTTNNANKPPRRQVATATSIGLSNVYKVAAFIDDQLNLMTAVSLDGVTWSKALSVTGTSPNIGYPTKNNLMLSAESVFLPTNGATTLNVTWNGDIPTSDILTTTYDFGDMTSTSISGWGPTTPTNNYTSDGTFFAQATIHFTTGGSVTSNRIAITVTATTPIVSAQYPEFNYDDYTITAKGSDVWVFYSDGNDYILYGFIQPVGGYYPVYQSNLWGSHGVIQDDGSIIWNYPIQIASAAGRWKPSADFVSNDLYLAASYWQVGHYDMSNNWVQEEQEYITVYHFNGSSFDLINTIDPAASTPYVDVGITESAVSTALIVWGRGGSDGWNFADYDIAGPTWIYGLVGADKDVTDTTNARAQFSLCAEGGYAFFLYRDGAGNSLQGYSGTWSGVFGIWTNINYAAVGRSGDGVNLFMAYLNETTGNLEYFLIDSSTLILHDTTTLVVNPANVDMVNAEENPPMVTIVGAIYHDALGGKLWFVGALPTVLSPSEITGSPTATAELPTSETDLYGLFLDNTLDTALQNIVGTLADTLPRGLLNLNYVYYVPNPINRGYVIDESKAYRHADGLTLLADISTGGIYKKYPSGEVCAFDFYVDVTGQLIFVEAGTLDSTYTVTSSAGNTTNDITQFTVPFDESAWVSQVWGFFGNQVWQPTNGNAWTNYPSDAALYAQWVPPLVSVAGSWTADPSHSRWNTGSSMHFTSINNVSNFFGTFTFVTNGFRNIAPYMNVSAINFSIMRDNTTYTDAVTIVLTDEDGNTALHGSGSVSPTFSSTANKWQDISIAIPFSGHSDWTITGAFDFSTSEIVSISLEVLICGVGARENFWLDQLYFTMNWDFGPVSYPDRMDTTYGYRIYVDDRDDIIDPDTAEDIVKSDFYTRHSKIASGKIYIKDPDLELQLIPPYLMYIISAEAELGPSYEFGQLKIVESLIRVSAKNGLILEMQVQPWYGIAYPTSNNLVSLNVHQLVSPEFYMTTLPNKIQLIWNQTQTLISKSTVP